MLSIFRHNPSDFIGDAVDDDRLAGKAPMLAALLDASLITFGEDPRWRPEAGGHRSSSQGGGGGDDKRKLVMDSLDMEPTPEQPRSHLLGATTAAAALERWAPAAVPASLRDGGPVDVAGIMDELEAGDADTG